MPSPAVNDAKTYGHHYKVRATRAKPIQLTERDVALLAAIHKYRVLHRGQVCDLFFAGVNDEGGSARRRLGLLYDHGYLERIPRFVSPPNNNPGPAYRLAARGAAILAHQAHVSVSEFNYWGKSEDADGRVSKLGHSYLEHALWLAEIRMAFERMSQAANCEIVTWLDYHNLRPSWKTERVQIQLHPGGKTEDVAIAPDGYFVLKTEKGRGHFFLEADRGSESLNQHWRRKILAYKAYLTSGKFHARHQVDRGIGFRVLTITTGRGRVTNLQKAAEKFGTSQTSQVFLFTEQKAFATASLSSPIWLRGVTTEAQALV